MANQKVEAEELKQNFLKIHPDQQFPADLSPKELSESIKISRGRKIIFSKQKDEYLVYFEDDSSEIIEIPKWNKLIGCGG